MTRLRDLSVRLGLAVSTAVVLAGWAAPAPVQGATPVELEVTTTPALPGATFEVGGATFTTDDEGRGVVELAAAPEEDVLPPLVLVDDGLSDATMEARFSRWWGFSRAGGTLTVQAVFDLYQLVTWSYAEADGRPIDAGMVSDLVVRSSHGNVHRFSAAEPVWLHALRVVPTVGGLSPKDIEYRIERVVVEGAEVVIRNQQKFIPSQEPHWTIALLFFDARFAATDALLGVPVGAAIQLEYPSGRVTRYPLDEHGQLTLRLPRGPYRALVEAPGMQVWTPVALSRDQETVIKVLTFADVGLGVVVIGGPALGLLFLGRPHLLRRRARADAVGTLPARLEEKGS